MNNYKKAPTFMYGRLSFILFKPEKYSLKITSYFLRNTIDSIQQIGLSRGYSYYRTRWYARFRLPKQIINRHIKKLRHF